jgi:CheY-like chemotaxis protein
MQLSVAASLGAASARSNNGTSESDISRIVEVARGTEPTKIVSSYGSRTQILWVDDHPENNVFVRRAFESAGLAVVTALSTSEALQKLSLSRYSAIISDMGRREGPREGYVLLDQIRANGDKTPLFFYASSGSSEHRVETIEHGGQGCTNNAEELFAMVMSVAAMQQAAR